MQSSKIRWPMTFWAGLAVVASAACTQSEAAQVDQASRFAREGAQAEARGEDGRERDERTALRLFCDGRRIFRFDTFGDEAFWGDTLRLHQAIEGAALGGIGPGVSPATALAVGLKVDVEALPEEVRRAIRQGKVDLNNPATTLALLKLNERYRTTPLGGLFTRAKGGFFHDGRVPTLLDVVNHYDERGIGNDGVTLGLTAPEKADLVEYLKSL